MRRATISLGVAACVVASAAAAPRFRRPSSRVRGAPDVSVSIEGEGSLRTDDGETLARLVRRSLERRFENGFERALATLTTQSSGSYASLDVEVFRPDGLPGVRSVSARIGVRGYRKALDLGSTRGVGLELQGMRATLEPAVLAGALAAQGEELEVRRILPGQSFTGGGSDPEARKAFLRAAHAGGFPPEGFGDSAKVVNRDKSSIWLMEGRLAPPIGNPGVVCARPRIIPGGRLALELSVVVAGGQARTRREVLALEQRVQDDLREWWAELERALDGKAYLTSGAIGPRGDLVVEGVGFLAFHFEEGVLAEEGRRTRWQPTVLVNPAR